MTENNETTPVKKVVPTIIDDDKNTKLHYSAAVGKEELLKDLESEQKIDTENYLGWTPLMMACRNGHLNAVELLLNHRADATKKNKYGMSVFLVSISSGKLEIVHLILQHLLCGGVSRQSMQKWFSPLSMAILFNDQHILRYLIEQSFDLNATTRLTGISPLMFAAAMENCEAFTLLISKGANATLKNCFGFTANGITEFRNQKLEGKYNETNFLNPANLITNGPHMQPQMPVPPYIVISSPQPTFYQLSPNQLVPSHMRKSSNTISPGFYFTTPNVTPITPLSFVPPPQVFFPPEFSPNQMYSTTSVPNYYNDTDFLNVRVNSSNVYLSPIPQTMNYPSPCV
ncbi:ankyrin-1-like [Anoplophora glabripennis]|uniref:ankyrin-1-like n=1 Tax=Anoplophora glabripennis TaxID=217634 RepID=UPI0008736C62|nr:ankyrin-1-like [Anoplophora glabripennis]